MKSYNLLDEKNSTDLKQREYRSTVKYDRKVPQFFDFGKLSKYENSATYAILGEIRDRYSPNGIVFSYVDIAYMAGYVKKDSDGVLYARTGKEFDKFISSLQKKLQEVAYRKFMGVINGKEEYEVYPLFNKFKVSHIKQELTVFLSDEQIYQEVIDENGNIVQPEILVKDLFNNADWSTTQYLKFSRHIHNNLSAPAQNLYRFLSEYRSWGKASMNAEVFEKKIMHFVTAHDKRNKGSILKRAVQELLDLKYDGHAIFPDLEYVIERKGRKAIAYHFTFQKFDIDLNYVEYDDTSFTSDESKTVIKESDFIDKEVLAKFHGVFSAQARHDNPHNRNQLSHYINSVSREVVIEALNRTAMDGRRGVGWFLKLLKNWEEESVKSLKDIEEAEGKIFNKPLKKEIVESSNIPKWSKEHPSNKDVKKDTQKVLSDRAKEIINERQNLLLKEIKVLDDIEQTNSLREKQRELQVELNQMMEEGTYYKS